jgi:hypothetical protein
MKVLLLSLLVATLVPMISQAKENTTPDAEGVDAACTAEATTAGCGTEKVGTGLLKCIHAYHQAHREFKPSAGCKTAMMKLHTDKRAAMAAEKKTK